MTPDAARAAYRDALAIAGEDIVIRFYQGTGGARSVQSNTTVRARVVDFVADELVGPIVKGDRKLIVLAAPLIAAGVTPVTGANCKAVVRGRELQIKSVDDNTRRIAGELIAYDLVAGG